jgi:acyl-coenzyme A synthetase/AMP-(fatty) acid ligase
MMTTDNRVPAIPQNVNMTELVLDRHVAAGRGERPALLFEDKVFSYSDLQRHVNMCANGLENLGIGRGDHFLVRSQNRPESVIAILAGMKLGAVPIPTNSLFRVWELEHILRNSQSKAVISSSELLEPVLSVRERCPDLKHIVTFDGPRSSEFVPFEDLMHGRSDSFRAADTLKDEPAFMIYTSGTTGEPKGVEHAHRWILANGDSISNALMRLTAEDITYSPLEISFIYALGCNLLFPLYSGAAVVMTPGRFDPDKTLAAIEKYRPTVFIGVPTLYRRLIAMGDAVRKYDLSSLRMGMSSGEPLPLDTAKQVKELMGVDIYDSLGQTEIHIFMNPDPRRKLGSLGTPLPGHNVSILTDDGKEAAIGEIGNLVLRSDDPGLSLGYRGRPEIWQKLHRNGWYYTNDLAYKDEDGFFWYASRSDDLIKSRAYLVSPQEIESAILEHPAVMEAGVIGVPDDIIGQRVLAFVVLRAGHAASEKLAEELIAEVRSKIAPFKVPKEIRFVESLPRTATGKLMRRELRLRVAQSSAASTVGEPK